MGFLSSRKARLRAETPPSRATNLSSLLILRANKVTQLTAPSGRRLADLGEDRLARRKKRAKRDVEKDYPAKQFVAKLRRLADCIEQSRRFRIQVAGERISIPPSAIINIEHERGAKSEEVEFQLKWHVDA